MSNDLGSCHVGGKLLDELKKLQGTQVLRLTGEDGVSYGVFRWDAAILIPKDPKPDSSASEEANHG
jgi:hypothetical protein